MSNPEIGPADGADSSLYMGAGAAALVALLPYVNVFIIPAYVLGAAVAVWYASRQGEALDFKGGAKLGFLSPFLGCMLAAIIVDLIWAFFDYQLWQQQNQDLMLGMFRSFASAATVDTMKEAFAQNSTKIFHWYFVLVQLLVNAIMAGIFGTLTGLLAVKIFPPRRRV